MTKAEMVRASIRVATELVAASDESLDRRDFEALRTVIRVALEVAAALRTGELVEDELRWNQDTVFSACESIMEARGAWQSFENGASPARADTFAKDRADLGAQLDAALGIVVDGAAQLSTRLSAVQLVARLELLFVGSTLS